MTEPATHIVIAGLPKSANVFIVRSLELTAAIEHVTIYPPGITSDQIDAKAFDDDFLAKPMACGGQHFPATNRNLDLLQRGGIKQIVVIVRDPRDAVVSWWHHLEREDVKSWHWHHAALVSSGLCSPGYYSLTQEQKLDDLIEKTYPFFQTWLREWADAIKGDLRFTYVVLRYEDFKLSPTSAIRKILGSHGFRPETIQLPELPSSGVEIDKWTHFRRGAVGSYKDEMSPEQIAHINSLVDQDLFRRFQWLPWSLKRDRL